MDRAKQYKMMMLEIMVETASLDIYGQELKKPIDKDSYSTLKTVLKGVLMMNICVVKRR